MSTPSSRFEELIAAFLTGSLSMPDFWKEFTFEWAEADDTRFSPADQAFFSEVADRLHYVDFTGPAEPFLEEPQEFRSWLALSASERAGT